jgi:hypothetical protein
MIRQGLTFAILFWHYQHPLIRKVLVHTVAVFLNLKLGRQPWDLDGLVTS